MTAIQENSSLNSPRAVPQALTWIFTAFMAVFVPVYWKNYGPTNFLYFCDVSLFLTLFALWRTNALAASMAAVGIVIPQIIWCADYAGEITGFHLTGMTSYMFDQERSLFLRGLSLFHGWLPFLLVYLVWRLGYDKRALSAWTVLAGVLCLISFFLLPPPSVEGAKGLIPVNVNYVFGISDKEPQHWMSPTLYLVSYFAALVVVFYLPAHFVLKKLFSNRPR